MQPLVSCIMPTYNRRAFISHAIGCFLKQTYPNKELIILDDGTDKIRDLVPIHPQIIYKEMGERMRLGSKRNAAIEMARGELIAIWDDDDWHAPNRLSYQIEKLLSSGKNICGLSRVYYQNIDTGDMYLFHSKTNYLMVDGTAIFKRTVFKPFEDRHIAATVVFIETIPLNEQLMLDEPNLYLATIHKNNTSPKNLASACWTLTDLKLEDIVK